ncbi:MAG: hypothetical protein KJT03_24310, partial [Verrucomicrobiae bacterium]|nr:hypothetical protein [Verrucomicrobiae bacterium]
PPLSIWDRGVKLTSTTDADFFAYLWFYEWTMFDAVNPGEHTGGTSDWKWGIVSTLNYAHTEGNWFDLEVTAVEDGADLALKITNTTNRSWPESAAIIPCFNPGYDEPHRTNAVANPAFFDDDYDHTYFMAKDGFQLLAGEAPREIHFNHALWPAINLWSKERTDGQFVWYHKWPTSQRDAYAGVIARESADRTKTMAILWEDFLSAQGHNPWKCMHLSVRVGPLNPGQSKTIRGKMYLIEGNREELMEKLKKDFPGIFLR